MFLLQHDPVAKHLQYCHHCQVDQEREMATSVHRDIHEEPTVIVRILQGQHNSDARHHLQHHCSHPDS